MIQSIADCAEEISKLDGEVILYNDSPGDAALDKALADVTSKPHPNLAIRVECNPENVGFVRTANRAIADATRLKRDLVLLNSDTVLTPGALTEMARVALADPMIGFVNPRSNNATLASLPYQARFRRSPPDAAWSAWAALAPRLPQFSYVPTANGFCMLIRWVVLAQLGGFDEIYGRGYNEENDLVMRASRRGYRAVLANHAFVWHQGSASFSLGREEDTLERRNREILVRRYPEYPRLTAAYFSSAEQRAELLLGTLIPDGTGRLNVALDFSSFVAAHNGTFVAGLQLLAKAAEVWSDRYNLVVLCAPETYAFHGMARFGTERRDPHGPELYSAIFRVGQPYDWSAVERMSLKAASVGVFMLDTISQDCAQLYDPEVGRLWSWTLEHFDLVAATSALTEGQLSRRFAFGPGVRRVRSLHSLDLNDYTHPRPEAEDVLIPPGYIFVVGNHYEHKDVALTVNALAEADPKRTIVALAGEWRAAAPADKGAYAPRPIEPRANVLQLNAGQLTPRQLSALYLGAAAVVSPSHYEGFGMAVLDALAARRPVFVRPLPATAELWSELGGDDNVHFFLTTADLNRDLARPPAWSDAGASTGRPGDAARAAADIGRAVDEMIAGVDYGRIVRRLASLSRQLAPPPAEPPAIAPTTPEAFVAQKIGARTEYIMTRMLTLPGVFPVLRSMARTGRRVRSFIRKP